MGLVGVASALFFISFQIHMRQQDSASGRPVTYSAGTYTFAWSMGFACGPMVSGALMQSFGSPAGSGDDPGGRYAFLLAAAVALTIFAVLSISFRKQRHAPVESAIAPVDSAPSCYDAMPDLARITWLVAAAGVIAHSINRTVFASRAVHDLSLADGTIGAILFVLFLLQALTGLALTRSRDWMYRADRTALFALPGVLGLICLGCGHHLALILAGAAMFGIYSGSFFFQLVFHALVHPARAGRYVAVNETVVGIASFAGPLLGGVLADAWGVQVPFLAAAGLTVVVTTLQCRIIAKSGNHR